MVHEALEKIVEVFPDFWYYSPKGLNVHYYPKKMIAEIQGYEEKIQHLVDQYISIYLNDGVKKNYEIFKGVLAKIR